MPQIDHTGPKLIHKQIVDWMHQQISSGNWPEHYRLPSEIDLAAQLNVSRGTMRKAITRLISEGLLLSIHGRGTFVASKTIEQPLADRLIGFSEAFIEKNIPFTTRVVRSELIIPPTKIASILAIPKGSQVFYLERVRSVGQTPLIYLNNYVNTALCPGIEQIDFETFRLFEVLENHYHLNLGWGQRTFEAQIPTETVAQNLEMNTCEAVMFLEQDLYLQNGSPIEFSNAWIRGSHFRLSSMVKRGIKHEANKNTWEFRIR